MDLDDIDLKILSLLQKDASLRNSALATAVGMAPSAVMERVKKLEQNQVIQGYVTRINPEALDLKLLAFIFIKSSEGPGDPTVANKISKIPEVLEVHHIAGEDCYLVKVRARDPKALVTLMREKFGKIPNIISTKTTIVLETRKEETFLPISKSQA